MYIFRACCVRLILTIPVVKWPLQIKKEPIILHSSVVFISNLEVKDHRPHLLLFLLHLYAIL